MSYLAIVGASSQIAKDLIRSIDTAGSYQLLLYVRDVKGMRDWLVQIGRADMYEVFPYIAYGQRAHDVVINFVGVGDPAKAAIMAGEIFEITLKFDQLILEDLELNPSRRYIFLSSGAAYGSDFNHPATKKSQATIPINALTPENYYSIAKLYTEARHRAHANLSIIDIRVFNYFCRHQNLKTRFLISDIVNALKSKSELLTSSNHMIRDYLHPSDFYNLITCLLTSPAANLALDCYSAAPIEKLALLDSLKKSFGLKYKLEKNLDSVINATGQKPNYYSTNKTAEEFGYIPKYTSLDTITTEISAILNAT
ncbi:NAD-dependent epimerase/dehydratase family protein [Pseudomonas sp. CF161]|uniref:NAD-dependent epimerase/dehydratase family protein n=1 Tax=Pseudomonas sp. CF161 TaxID=911241 RepID=UPI0003552032|nr:NAD-dependent epimerase/dehydratase family protein [Pseudomonas sp. CF161]EPL08520.1 putative dTDP-glucose 4,6-dehydratase [Pseudomonas sp. CF161]